MNKKVVHNLIKLGTILVMISLLITACAPAATVVPTSAPTIAPTKPPAPTATTPPKTVKVVMATIYPKGSIPGGDQAIEKFKATHPGIELEVQVTDYATFVTKVLTQIAGGDPPDIITIENRFFTSFAKEGVLEDLTPYMSKTAGMGAQDFFKDYLDRFSLDGKVYAIPQDAQPAGIVLFNSTVFDEVKIAYPTNDWTWNDYLEAAKKLTKVNADGTVARYGSGSIGWRYWIYGAGGRAVDNYKNPTKSLLDSPEAIQAAQFYTDMVSKYKVVPDPKTITAMGGSTAENTMVFDKKIAMKLSSSPLLWLYGTKVKDAGLKLVLAPKGPTGKYGFDTGGTGYAILKSAKNKPQAWEFISYFLGQAGIQEQYNNAPLNSIIPPANVVGFDWYLKQPHSFIDTLEPLRKAMDYVVFDPIHPRWYEIEAKCIKTDWDAMAMGLKPVESTMKTIAQCVTTELAIK